jgi:ankyrin repeat protein
MNKFLTLIILTLLVISKTSGQTTTSQIKKLIKAGDLKSVSQLVENGLDINTTFKGKSTLLHYAAVFGKYNIAKYLVDKGANLNLQDNAMNTPLMISTSVFSQYDSISNLLINKDANLNIVGYAGSTALRNTIGIGGAGQQPDIFKLLIDKGADINFQCDKCCNTTIYLYCCAWGTTEMLQQLIDKKVDINNTDCKGLNGLMYAIKLKNIDTIKLLFTTSIDMKHKDKKGKTALDYAYKSGDDEIIMLIKSFFFASSVSLDLISEIGELQAGRLKRKGSKYHLKINLQSYIFV